ncbi:hypothetical protein [Lewinella sp. 4G2]|uniref:hypothetical protein n=1 Tax=Lewinella sp. 4G2 TaxID=1803372 RepID=UPI0007B4D569|nr:hypothetical protein [Lewinella sp. 4G2]OAV44168.1 hypothetical protein A3850_006510 [Lewinella sp. 4G2]
MSRPISSLSLLILAFTLLATSACTDPKPGTRGSAQETDGQGRIDGVEYTDAFAAYPGQDTMAYRPFYLHPIPEDDVLNDSVTPFGAYGQLLPPMMSDARVQLLTTNLWAVEYYINEEGTPRQNIYGTGQWMQFFPDGHFIAGHWDRQTHAGAYYVDLSGKYPMVTFDSNVDRMDTVWEMQRISDDRENMAWRRAIEKGFGPKSRSIVLRLNKLYDRPTREQYRNVFAALERVVD